MKIFIELRRKPWVYSPRIYLVFLLMLFCSDTFAQQATITLTQGRKTILSVFEEIEQQTKMTIAYNESAIDVRQTIDINVTNQPLAETMAIVLKGTNLTYRIQGKQIILITRPKEIPLNKYTGVITDPYGESVIGASITLKDNTSIGTITDFDGNFSIEAPVGSTLLVSFVGYISKEIKLGNKTSLQITLKEDAQILDEVVVVGYGVMRKRDVSTSIAQVKAEDIAGTPVTDFR